MKPRGMECNERVWGSDTCGAVRLRTTVMAEAGQRNWEDKNVMDRELFKKHVVDGNNRRARCPREC